MSRDLLIRRNNLRDFSIDDVGAEPALSPGQARMRIDRFAITANNITYGVFGDALKYWSFFPVQEGYGSIPVWGFADVEESACDSVSTGDRLYGYWPMSDRVVVEPKKVSPLGWSDGIAHRAELPPVYNRYSRTAADPVYKPELEAEHMLLFPLFSTSFVLWDFLVDNDCFGASNLILTSASSKTAIGTARMFHQHPVDGVTLTALTSESNVAFVESLGIYDSVLSYEAADTLPQTPAVLLDFSGSQVVRSAIHARVDQNLRYSCAIGATHWDAEKGADSEGRSRLPGPKPIIFFAPAQIQKRFKEWGAEVFQERLAENWFAFVEYSHEWMTVETVHGLDAAASVFSRFLNREASPTVGYIVQLGDDDG